ncbi:MAG: hypothetical protein ACREBG_27530 [Pyrinomonadaceae bacterium]
MTIRWLDGITLMRDFKPRRFDLFFGLVIFVIAYLAFLTSHVHQSADSKYSMLLGESLLRHRSFALDHYQIPGLNVGKPGEVASRSNIYQLEFVNTRIYYAYPPGSSILSVPYILIMNALGLSSADADGTYNAKGETKIEASLAALLMAAFAITVFYASRLLLPVYWSVVVAAGTAFGSQVWSTASRAMWSDTWGIFLMGLVVWLLLAAHLDRQRLRPVLLGSLLSWAYFVRPTYCLPLMAISAYIAFFHPAMLARYAATRGVVDWLHSIFLASFRHSAAGLLQLEQADLRIVLVSAGRSSHQPLKRAVDIRTEHPLYHLPAGALRASVTVFQVGSLGVKHNCSAPNHCFSRANVVGRA